MADIKLSDEEIDILRLLLSVVVVERRTKALGITHGMNRFVSTNQTLRRNQLEALESLAKKLDLSGGIRSYDRE